ncbi:MAG: PKD domain-containing protein, partial [Candidatus Thermoplasmatota archaeon]
DFSYVQSVEEVYKYISVPNLTFMRTNEVPTGEYLVAFSAGDYGNNHGFNYSALLVDTTKPAVESISLLPESPVNASEVTFTITFTEAVNQSVELNVTFGLASPYTNHTINGAWQSSTTWVGAHLINNTTGDGVNTIRVANAVDQAKNIMDPDTSNTFIIDTIKPVADAGNDQTINQHVLVILNGSRSTDVNGSGIVNYTWKFTDVVLYTLYGEKVNYTFHNAGTYSITLTIKDAAGNLDIDTLTITVKDTTPPTVDYTPPELPQPKGKPIKIELTVTDNVEVANVTLYYRKLAEAKWKSLPMTKGAGDLWSGEIPAEYVTDDIFYYFVATDTSGNNVTEPPGGKEDPYKIGVAVVVPAEALDLRILGMIAVVIIVIVSLVGLVYYKHKKEKLLAKKPTIIDEVFLIYRDGRLIKHFTRRLKPIDDAILASMLVAVRDFVRDVFKGEPGVLEEMRFGELKFIIGMGKYIVIAAVILGPELELVKPQIAKAIKAIEQEHWSILERWDGDLDKVAPLSMYIEDLIAGKYK